MPTSALHGGRPLVAIWWPPRRPSSTRNSKATSALRAGRPPVTVLGGGIFENFARSRKSARRSKKRNKESTLFERLFGFEFCPGASKKSERPQRPEGPSRPQRPRKPETRETRETNQFEKKTGHLNN